MAKSFVESPLHSVQALNYVWDADLLDWAVETQPSGGGGGGGAVTIADGANVVEGTTTDVAVYGDVNGTISAKLRGISTLLEGPVLATLDSSESEDTQLGITSSDPVVTLQMVGGVAKGVAPNVWRAKVAQIALSDSSLYSSLTQGTGIPLIGQTTMSGSLPVTLASDQPALPVSVTSTPNLSVSAANSSTTPLLASTTFTGTYVDVSNYAGISIIAVSDNSTTASVSVDWSADGVNKDKTTILGYQGDASSGRYTTPLYISVAARYARINVTNVSGFDMTFLRMTTYLVAQPQTRQVPFWDPAGQDSISEGLIGTLPLGASAIMGVDPGSGNYTRVITDGSGRIGVMGPAIDTINSAQINRTQLTKLTDGTRDGTIKAASTPPVASDTALVVSQRDSLPAGTNVLGHVVTDSGSTTTVTGTVAVSGAVTQGGTWTTKVTDGNYTASLDPTGAVLISSDALNRLLNVQITMLQEIRALRLLWGSVTNIDIPFDGYSDTLN